MHERHQNAEADGKALAAGRPCLRLASHEYPASVVSKFRVADVSHEFPLHDKLIVWLLGSVFVTSTVRPSGREFDAKQSLSIPVRSRIHTEDS